MESEVIIMGKIMERTYTDDIFETEVENLGKKAFNLKSQSYRIPKVVEKTIFKEYIEIMKNKKISKDLRKGDFIYFPVDNREYKIEKVLSDTEGNIVYFIDKIVNTVDKENIEAKKLEVKIKIRNWVEQQEEQQAELQEKARKLAKKSYKNTNKNWRLFG